MPFAEFSALFSDLYLKARGQAPFNITIRRAYNRIGFHSPATVTARLQEELAS